MMRTFQIYEDKVTGLWVFSGEDPGSRREAIVGGVDKLIEKLIVRLKEPRADIELAISSDPFSDQEVILDLQEHDADECWFRCSELDLKGWLAPRLFKEFDETQEKLYVDLINRPDAPEK